MSDKTHSSQQPPGTPDVGCSGVMLAWCENLKPLGRPEIYRDHPWPMDSHIARLYERCDALLRRCEEQERLILNLIRR